MRLLLAMIATALVPCASQAQEYSILHRAGAWSAYVSSGTTGQVMCGFFSMDPQTRGNINVKWQYGQDGIRILYSSPTLSPQPDTSIFLVGQIGQNAYNSWAPYVAPNIIQGSITDQQASFFLDLVAKSSIWRVSFPQSREPTWNLSLFGSSAIITHFRSCVREVSLRLLRGE
jgi:hypothetical protein